MSESKTFAYKKPKYYAISGIITTVCYEHQTCTKDFSKDSTTLQYLKCWVVTTSGIAGLQENSIKNNTLNWDGTQILLMYSFN